MPDGPLMPFRIARPRRKATTVALVALVTVTSVVLGGVLGGLGLAASLHSSLGASNAPTVTVSLFAALSAADVAAAGVNPGSWIPVAAAGLAPDTTVSLPGPEYGPSYNCTNLPPSPQAGGGPGGGGPPCAVNSTGPPPATPCGWTPLGGHNLSSNESIVVPAASGAVGTGLAPFWAVEYVDGSNLTLYVVVLGGTATPYATVGGPACGPLLAHYQSLEGTVVNSPTAAAIVNAWGGAAFLANSTNLSALYEVAAPVTFEGITYVCGNSTSPNGSITINGTCPNSTFSYSVPATWFIEYSSCWLPLYPYATACHSPGVLAAELNGSTGAPIFVTISTGWRCGWTPVCIYGPVASGASAPGLESALVARTQ